MIQVQRSTTRRTIHLFCFNARSHCVYDKVFLFPAAQGGFSKIIMVAGSGMGAVGSSGATGAAGLTMATVLTTLSTILVFFRFPLKFVTPSFCRFSFSRIPILIKAFDVKPVTNMMVRFMGVLIGFLVGNADANKMKRLTGFLVNYSFVLPTNFVCGCGGAEINTVIKVLANAITVTTVNIILGAFILIPLCSSFVPLARVVGVKRTVFPTVSNAFAFYLCYMNPFGVVGKLVVSMIIFVVCGPLSELVGDLSTLLAGGGGTAIRWAQGWFLISGRRVRTCGDVQYQGTSVAR